jgi:hypothetical protein
MSEFNLYREAKVNYDRIVPEKLDGLILLSLFDKFGDENFTEDEINVVIDKVYKDLVRQSQRNEYDRNSTIVIKFQEFFIWRDAIKRTYSFKPYGKEFCLKIKTRLENRYSPAEIKRRFDSLHLELTRHLEDKELGFLIWFNEQFSKRTSDITVQVEILDQQVSESVSEFRIRIKKDDVDLFLLLEEIETGLDEIKGFANQLKESFKATYDIENKLQDLLADTYYHEFISEINITLNFLSHIRSQLEQVSIRIDKIKPRVREFIYEFNQRDFDRKTVSFLNVLLQHSTEVKNEKGKSTLELPQSIPRIQLYNSVPPPKFIVVPDDRDISPKTPIEPVKQKVNIARQEERVKVEQQKIHEKLRVQFWFKHVITELNENITLDYTSLFYDILQKENSNLSIVVRLTNKLIRELSMNSAYKVIIIQQLQSNPSYPKIKLWKMKIQKV